MKKLQKMYLLYPHVYEKLNINSKISLRSQSKNVSKTKTKPKKQFEFSKNNNFGKWMKMFQSMLKDKIQTNKKNNNNKVFEALSELVEKEKQTQFINDSKTFPSISIGTQTINKDTKKIKANDSMFDEYTHINDNQYKYDKEKTLIENDDDSDEFNTADETVETETIPKQRMSTRLYSKQRQKGKGYINWKNLL